MTPRLAACACVLVLAACGGERGDAGASAAAVAPSGGAGAAAPVLPPMPPDSARGDSAPAGRTTGPGDSVPNTSKGPSGPTPLPMPQPQGAARPSDDTLRGVVAIVGAEPMTEVVLRPAGGRTVILTGLALPELRELSGVEIMVRGRPATGVRPTFAVAGYAVRAVDGAPAVDGVVTTRGGATVLAGGDGRVHRLDRAPAGLRAQRGAHAWISTNPQGEIVSYGIIRPRS